MYFYSRSSLDPGSVYVEPPSNRITPLYHAVLARVGDGGARNPLSPPISTFPYSRTPTGIAPSLYVSARALLKHSTTRARTQLDKLFHQYRHQTKDTGKKRAQVCTRALRMIEPIHWGTNPLRRVRYFLTIQTKQVYF